MVDLVKMLSHRKGDQSAYRPEAGTICLISGPHCDDENGYTFGEFEVLWSDALFVLYRKDGCWPVLNKWEHIIAKPITAPVPASEAAKAPWPDFFGRPIHHGDRLAHPDGSEFVAVRLNHADETEAWRAVYDTGYISRLCLQIGEKGQAVLLERCTLAAPAAPTDAKADGWDYELMGLPNEEVAAMWRKSGHSGTVPFSFAQRIQDAMQSIAAQSVRDALELDAQRWRALLGSQRIRMLGSAGLNKPEPNDYAHFGMEIWTKYSRNYSPELLKEMDDGNALGREWLTKYADIAIRALIQSPQPGEA